MAKGPRIYGGRWKTINTLGEGGQSHVYEVVDLEDSTQRTYALKRLKRSSPERLGRFRNELAALQKIRHARVISIIDFRLEDGDGYSYFVTDLLPRTLADTRDGLVQLPLAEKLRLFEDVCSGLATAHGAGIVHRDIKPENILLTDNGDAVVADFGIAYIQDGERHTLLDEAVGGQNFISPELQDGRAADVSPQADVYALGKLLYWLLSNGITFAREGHREPGRDLIARLRPPARDHYAIEHLNEMMDRMITTEPAKRFDSAGVVLQQLSLKRYLIDGRYPPLSPAVDHFCNYCGIGRYRLILDGHPTSVRNFGLTPVGGAQAWHALVCDNCGHVELFRRDRANWWGPRAR